MTAGQQLLTSPKAKTSPTSTHLYVKVYLSLDSRLLRTWQYRDLQLGRLNQKRRGRRSRIQLDSTSKPKRNQNPPTLSAAATRPKRNQTKAPSAVASLPTTETSSGLPSPAWPVETIETHAEDTIRPDAIIELQSIQDGNPAEIRGGDLDPHNDIDSPLENHDEMISETPKDTENDGDIDQFETICWDASVRPLSPSILDFDIEAELKSLPEFEKLPESPPRCQNMSPEKPQRNTQVTAARRYLGEWANGFLLHPLGQKKEEFFFSHFDLPLRHRR